jgi:hypothetical protein
MFWMKKWYVNFTASNDAYLAISGGKYGPNKGVGLVAVTVAAIAIIVLKTPMFTGSGL